GTIRSVSGGRSIVDFNNPLAGKAVVYDIKILRIIEDDEEKLRGFAKLHLNFDASLKEGIADVKVKLPKQLHKLLEDKIKEL
ncbi:MAG: peptidylprolyl isomerase, partial [Nanoarchaeota archaeon]